MFVCDQASVKNHDYDLRFIYYISNDEIESNQDFYIAKYLGLTKTEYQDILIHKFNGRSNDLSGEIYFQIHDDCERAMDYLNKNLDGFLVAKKLNNSMEE